MGRNRRRGGCSESSPMYWQTEDFNTLCYNINVDLLLSIAVNRFRWVGLPDTCDARFLEIQLHKTGIATLCFDEKMPDVWESLIAAPSGTFNKYGIPNRWTARGYEGGEYSVTPANGELVYYSQTRLNPWGAIVQYATKLTHIQRTADVNLQHQQKPWVMLMPQEKRMELVNLYKQASGYEPVILGDSANRSLLELNEGNCFTLDLKTPFIGKELNEMYQNTLNQFLVFMGVPHIMFEKTERMITEEAQAGNSVTNITLLNCLAARRQALDMLRERWPERFKDANVYLNDDWESYNYNYVNNLSQLDEKGASRDGEGEVNSDDV